MIKLLSLYNEIKLVGANMYPKDKKWSKEIKTSEEYNQLMQILEKLGYKWQSGNLPTQFIDPVFFLPVIIHNKYNNKDIENGRLTWTSH